MFDVRRVPSFSSFSCHHKCHVPKKNGKSEQSVFFFRLVSPPLPPLNSFCTLPSLSLSLSLRSYRAVTFKTTTKRIERSNSCHSLKTRKMGDGAQSKFSSLVPYLWPKSLRTLGTTLGVFWGVDWGWGRLEAANFWVTGKSFFTGLEKNSLKIARGGYNFILFA